MTPPIKYVVDTILYVNKCCNVLFKGTIHQMTRNISVSCISHERFGTSEGGSGWSWDKGGIGMGGKEAGILKCRPSGESVKMILYRNEFT